MADAHKGSRLCVLTHFGRKEDESGTLLVTIEDILGKMESAKPGEGLECGTLACGNMQFQLTIYPNGEAANSVGAISAEVMVVNHGKTQWKSMEFLAAENDNGIFFRNATCLLTDNANLANGVAVNILTHRAVRKRRYSSFFPKGVLTVKVNVTVRGEETVVTKTTKLPDESITTSQLKGELSAHLRKMMESQQFSDFRIICQGEVIDCHRSMLAARSDIFGAMFEHNMKENKTGEVEIVDFDLETVQAVILHIYTGDVEYNQENVKQLIRAADKYQLQGLKKKIEDALIKEVKIENAIDMFVLGDAVHADKLRDLSKEVIVKNAVAIVENDNGWKERLGRFHDLAMEIFESFVKSKSQTN